MLDSLEAKWIFGFWILDRVQLDSNSGPALDSERELPIPSSVDLEVMVIAGYNLAFARLNSEK